MAMCKYAGYDYGACENNSNNRAAIEARIPILMDTTNTAFQESGSNIEVRLVQLAYLPPQYDYLEPNAATLSFARSNPTVQGWREASGADLVAVISGKIGNCGFGSVGPCTNCHASTTSYSCFGAHSFTHELGREYIFIAHC